MGKLTPEERAAKRAADREEYRRWAAQHAPDKEPPAGSKEAKQRDRVMRGEKADVPRITVSLIAVPVLD